MANAEHAAALGDLRLLHYRGRIYSVPPVPYPAGLQLEMIQHRLATLARDGTASDDQVESVIADAVALFGRLVYRGWLHRLLPNPFRHSSEGEVGALLAFFQMCRMASTVRSASPKARARPLT